jgi:hypothetical protein
MGLGDKAKDVAIEHVKQKAARDILTGIKDWRGDKILTAKRRWIFELIQNAIDTAKARQNDRLKIEVKSDENFLMFKHNAGYFTLDEISATIYGGSTKPYAPESEYIGRFGTGFLVTHIISRKVKISGSVKDNDNNIYYFNELFMDRREDDENKISQSIEDCFKCLNDAHLQNKSTEFWTKFSYYSNDSLGLEAIKQGIDELRKNLPFIFAFNKINEITINGKKYTTKKGKKSDIMTVEVEKSVIYIKQDEENSIQVGVPIENGKILSSADKPKIFIGMPLTETVDYINIPFIINSFKFDPTTERNALNNNATNIKLIQTAFDIYYKLLIEIRKEIAITDIFNLLNFQFIPDDKVSQNPLWLQFNDCIQETFEEIIKNVPLIDTLDGIKEIKNAIFPVDLLNDKSIGDDNFNNFYDLTCKIKKNAPKEDMLNSWVSTAKKLKEVFPEDISIYTIEDMKNELQTFIKSGKEYPYFEDLKEKYNLSDSKQFLLDFFEIANSLYNKQIISENFIEYLLPDQNGSIGPIETTCSDVSISLHLENCEAPIPDELKGIAEKIGRPIRHELIDTDFSKFKIIKDYVRNLMSVDLVLTNLLNNNLHRLQGKIKNLEDEKVKGWIELFRWCVLNERLIINFPVITKNSEVKILEDLNNESLLIPFKYIGIKEEYEEIYPENILLHQEYFEIEEIYKTGFIEKLHNYKAIVNSLPLYRKEVSYGYNKLKSILLENEVEISKVDHKIESETDTISVLPFWSEVIGKISEYPERAKLLLTFIIGHIIENDESWENVKIVKCSCKQKSHQITPSYWLASLKTDAWIPFKTIENEEEKIVKREASKESIENLFSHGEFEALMKTNPHKLMKLLPHLGFDELDLNIKLHSIKTGKTEEILRKDVSNLVVLTEVADILPDIKELVAQDPSGFKEAIQDFKEKLEKGPIKDENRKIGENVEIIIEKILREMGIRVKPIYRGGDLELWPEINNIGWDSGLIEIKPYIIEIKFTSSTRAHLSKVQSEMAGDTRENYMVLVIENGGNLRDQLNMDIEENYIPSDLKDALINDSHIIENVYLKLGSVPDPEEIEPDIKGYWIKRKLWNDKVDFVNWAQEKFGDII